MKIIDDKMAGNFIRSAINFTTYVKVTSEQSL